MSVQILLGDCIEQLKGLPAGIVQTCVTSPPYWGLRDYGVAGQLGMEPTPEEYTAHLVEVFAEVRRVLADDGTLWVNLGDSYAGSGKGGNPEEGKQATNKGSQSIGVLYGKIGESARTNANTNVSRRSKEIGLKPKDLVGIPWRVAFALQANGWYLRQDIIWAKPNPMPESVTDRCTKAHEYIFLLSKQERYYYDAEAIAEPATYGEGGGASSWRGERTVPRESRKRGDFNGKTNELPGREAFRAIRPTRNKRSVWTVATQPFSGAHFATYPEKLIEPCVLAGSRPGDTVLDPFNGSGTTGAVAVKHHRNYIGIELNPDYIELTNKRLAEVQPVLFAPAEVTA